MRNHEWRDRTDDGELRLVRAEHHAGRWRLLARLKSEPAFRVLDPPPLHDLQVLLGVIDGKYRRNRAPFHHLAEVEALIAEAELREPQ